MTSSLDQAVETQLRNIETKTGLVRADLFAALAATGLDKHAALLAHGKSAWGLGHGDANALALQFRQATVATDAGHADPLDALYSGKTAGLRPLHDAVMTAIATFGPADVAPKKGYVALRRKKQFAMLGPKGAARLELGINLKDPLPDPPFKTLPPGGMCQYTVPISAAGDIDADLIAVLRRAYDAAG
jgi:Domain of unknown function (DUF5655)/Domain of unknown function (DUF4287)